MIGITPAWFTLRGQVGGLPAVNPAAHDAFGVLDRNPALAFLNCHDTGDDQSSDNNQGHQAQDADGTCVQVFKEPYRTLGHPGNDTGKIRSEIRCRCPFP